MEQCERLVNICELKTSETLVYCIQDYCIYHDFVTWTNIGFVSSWPVFAAQKPNPGSAAVQLPNWTTSAGAFEAVCHTNRLSNTDRNTSQYID